MEPAVTTVLAGVSSARLHRGALACFARLLSEVEARSLAGTVPHSRWNC